MKGARPASASHPRWGRRKTLHRVRRPDGAVGWVRSRAVPLFDARGGTAEWVGVASDVTASKQAEAELFHERQRLRALLAALPVGVAFTDSPGCERITGNRALREQLGGPCGDIAPASAPGADALARRVAFYQHGKPIAMAQLPLQRAAREGRAIGPAEFLARLPDGRALCLEVRAEPVRDAQGRVVGAVAVSTDLAERHRVLQAHGQMRLKDEFLALLGHELRNPLTAISTAVDLLGSDLTAVERHTVRRHFGSQVAVLKRLAEDLLDISRSTLGTLGLQCTSVSLAELLEVAAAAARPFAVQRGQVLVVSKPDAPVHFRGDPVRLQQVLANLLDNAIKYAGRGARIELLGALEGANVVLRCRDNGRGLAPEVRERIFESLVRLAPAGRDAPGGMGLGLALVRRLAELHGGSASVQSRRGAGSEFIVRIPFRSAARAAWPEDRHAPAASGPDEAMPAAAVEGDRARQVSSRSP